MRYATRERMDNTKCVKSELEVEVEYIKITPITRGLRLCTRLRCGSLLILRHKRKENEEDIRF